MIRPESLVLTVAPNGSTKGPADHPGIPLTPESLAATARSCLDAGAGMIHLHVRDSRGAHSLDAAAYRAATEAVRRSVGTRMVVQVTTEAAGVFRAPEQMAVVREVRPEAVSIGLRELAAGEAAEPEFAAFMAGLVRERVITQVILYDAADLLRWRELKRRGVVPEGRWFLQFVLGRYSSGSVSSPRDLLAFLAADDGAAPWAVCAFGPQEHACALAAAALGGHVRVGFENNLFLRDGAVAPDNAALVRQVAEGAAALGRPLATADEIRRRFTP